MSKIQREQEQIEKYQYPEYTKQELWALNNLLKEKYNDGMKNADITKWFQDEGALNEYGAVIYTGEQPTKYEILQDKLSKANFLLGRKEFAQKKELEDIEKSIKIDMPEIEYQDIK